MKRDGREVERKLLKLAKKKMIKTLEKVQEVFIGEGQMSKQILFMDVPLDQSNGIYVPLDQFDGT